MHQVLLVGVSQLKPNDLQTPSLVDFEAPHPLTLKLSSRTTPTLQ